MDRFEGPDQPCKISGSVQSWDASPSGTGGPCVGQLSRIQGSSGHPFSVSCDDGVLYRSYRFKSREAKLQACMLSVSLLRDRGGRMQMTGSEGLLTNHSELAVVTRNQWEVEFSRFFNLPRWASGAPAGLRALPKGKIRATGTWITSSSPALLLLHKPTDASAFVLSVNVQQYALEEHFVSSLLFSWPQVSCVSQCPVRGSRVVFMSYMDVSSQASSFVLSHSIQKFAVRFPTCTDVEAFLAFVKVHIIFAFSFSFSPSDLVDRQGC
ncbi:hypothetical protein B296_00005766 [Ensete ventricosum]|uniref:Poor homologous synapsis 1 PH domain-containing protein n=1 Tax=Ensete ventricosum TaxID=4639 RepID=A0A426ZHK4_ENSVE|nr:hypothetical protein B296_00005766 [Ensete ventricosum]